MEPSDLANKVMVAVYLMMIGLVMGERLSHSAAGLELRGFYRHHLVRLRALYEYRGDFLRMAYQVWETTGQRIDRG